MSQILRISTANTDRITLVNAGLTQNAICAPIVYLEAHVIGDASRHTFEWVQISGTPLVDLQIVSPTQAYYVVDQGNVGSDKVFRLYVDRHSPIEQHADVIIRTTPSSTVNAIEGGTVRGVVTPDPNAAIPQSRNLISAPFDTGVPFNSQAIYNPTPLVLQWGLPNAFYQSSSANNDIITRQFIGSVLELWNGTSWQVIAQSSGLTPGQGTVPAGARLRLGARYATLNGPQTVYAPWFDLGGGIVAMNTAANNLEGGTVKGAASKSSSIFKIDIQDYQETINPIEAGVVSVLQPITRYAYQLDPQTYDEMITPIEGGVVRNVFTVTRNSGGSIGG